MMKEMCTKAMNALRSLGRYSFEKKYDLTLALYADDSASTPECSHRFSGSSRHNLLKIVCLAVILCAAMATILMLFGCGRRDCKKK